ncbi:MAG: MBL fold metallo-hydrolase [Gemmataceae bacterium]|nr:MBL fold metallo-hydrolase [Gemmataceae bacterium]
MKKSLPLLALLFSILGWQAFAADTLFPELKFNEVKEVAPGVFFRYSSISATDKTVPFGGSNNIWVVFDDYVAVIDANFPDGAEEVVKAIRKTTTKPIRYVFDTHHHGDHAYGNAVFFKEGATVIAQANCAQLLREVGPLEFAEAGKGPTGRKDVAQSFLKAPSLVFDDRLVLDDGKQRVEFLFLAHGHTSGDAVAWLPKHKILCTGDSCVNGAYNFMGHADSASWIVALEKMQDLKPAMICPGHGPVDGAKLVEKQKRYFVELRQEVEKGLKVGKDLEAIGKGIKFPWYEEWTGVTAKPDNIEHVYKEMTGRVTPPDLLRDLGLAWGIPPAGKPAPGWKAPRRIVVRKGLMPWKIAELKGIAPEVEFVPAEDEEEAKRVLGDAEAVLGFSDPGLISAGKNLRWVHPSAAGAEDNFLEPARKKGILVTTEDAAKAPAVANQILRHVLRMVHGKNPTELQGKLLLVSGSKELVEQLGLKTKAFGLRVRALEGERGEALALLVSGADFFVVGSNASGVDWASFPWAKLPATSHWVFLSPPPGANLGQLAKALNTQGYLFMDFADWPQFGRSLTQAGLPTEKFKMSVENRSLMVPPSISWKLLRENVRRFASGEPLLGTLR